jgi:hypothetical protein
VELEWQREEGDLNGFNRFIFLGIYGEASESRRTCRHMLGEGRAYGSSLLTTQVQRMSGYF